MDINVCFLSIWFLGYVFVEDFSKYNLGGIVLFNFVYFICSFYLYFFRVINS